MPATQNAIAMAQFPEQIIEWVWEPEFVGKMNKDIRTQQFETMKNRQAGK